MYHSVLLFLSYKQRELGRPGNAWWCDNGSVSPCSSGEQLARGYGGSEERCTPGTRKQYKQEYFTVTIAIGHIADLVVILDIELQQLL